MLAVDAFVRLIPIIQDDIPRYIEKKAAISRAGQLFISLNGEIISVLRFLYVKI